MLYNIYTQITLFILTAKSYKFIITLVDDEKFVNKILNTYLRKAEKLIENNPRFNFSVCFIVLLVSI